MCSIVGYVGKRNCRDFVIEGLRRLEYRGYDSAGFSCMHPSDNRLVYIKAKGSLSNLVGMLEDAPIDGFLGIGHTRWATHGPATTNNAHPHFNCEKTVAVVHNGIVENHHELRNTLKKSGHVFHSETDTEVIAHFLSALISQEKSLKKAICLLVSELDGAFAFLALAQEFSDTMIAVRRRSPLCIGIGDKEVFAASDFLAFAGNVKKVLFMPDESFAIIKKDEVKLFDFSGNPLPLHIEDIHFDWSKNEKGGFEHYMLKEIYEQKEAIYASVKMQQSLENKILDYMGLSENFLKEMEGICMVGAGTSWHAGRIAQFFFEMICGIPASVSLASEFRYRPFFPNKKCLYIAISQSGETADTLEALRKINASGAPTVILANVASSTMVREANGFLLTKAGPEIAVASTKAFTTQISVLYWLANKIAFERGLISRKEMDASIEDLLISAQVLECSIDNYKRIIKKDYAKTYSKYDRFIFLGRHVGYPLALEAALKLKEISYIFSQSYPAGELKHGPIALIDDRTPVFLFSHIDDLIYQKIVANAQEVKARGGHLVSFIFEGQHELEQLSDVCFVFPKVAPLLAPIAMVGVMQFFVYCIANELGCPIDKPRNLAKSVTVE
ncbi:glutamine--fructose-6-phosphate transaminase (isomerizing) [bacterium]|jgi:glutamine---fructose-6-phosphate transaminase (isomerizing)|nr:glutamine--fructose-6-phosphate transaminase (isomerizing) [bacterium]